ncbi:substrate-binding domain-containing protein [Tumidithrix helvetica]|uniref:substrate-binding domain-containing protein n=1 Tax=Tumidithrix helvetica TaxID=3457545 RepID=UPI003CC52A29
MLRYQIYRRVGLCASAIALTATVIGVTGCNVFTTETQSTQPATQTTQLTKLTVTSGSSTAPLLTALITVFKPPKNAIAVNELPASQSESALAGLKNGDIHLVMTSSTLPTDDASIKQQNFAKDGLLVAVHPSVTGVTNLTTQQLQDIYSGKTTNWKDFGGPDAAIVVLDRPEDESAKRLLRKHYLGKNLPNAAKAIVLRKETELIKAIQITPYSIGAFSLSQALTQQLPVQHLSLNGIKPAIETVETGKYPMVRSVTLAFKSPVSEPVQQFLDFAYGSAGQEVLRKNHYSPVKL